MIKSYSKESFDLLKSGPNANMCPIRRGLDLCENLGSVVCVIDNIESPVVAK